MSIIRARNREKSGEIETLVRVAENNRSGVSEIA